MQHNNTNFQNNNRDRSARNNLKILALETSTDACSVALLMDDTITLRYQVAPQQHTKLILPMIDELLTEAKITLHNLDAIAFAQGPGSFTGIRIAASVTQGLALGANLPVVPISTLQGIAQRAYEENNANNILVALDARMQEVYFGIYQYNASQEICTAMIADGLYAPDKTPLPQTPNQDWIGVGNGWQIYQSHFQNQPFRPSKTIDLYPSANYIAKLAKYKFMQGNIVKPDSALPIYLRN